MSLLRALQGRRKSGRFQNQFDEALLFFDGQVDGPGFIDTSFDSRLAVRLFGHGSGLHTAVPILPDKGWRWALRRGLAPADSLAIAFLVYTEVRFYAGS